MKEARANLAIRVVAVAATLLYFTWRAWAAWGVMTSRDVLDLAQGCLAVVALALCVRTVPATNPAGHRIGLGKPPLLAMLLMAIVVIIILYGGVVSWLELRCANEVRAAKGSLEAEALCFRELRAKRGI